MKLLKRFIPGNTTLYLLQLYIIANFIKFNLPTTECEAAGNQAIHDKENGLYWNKANTMGVFNQIFKKKKIKSKTKQGNSAALVLSNLLTAQFNISQPP